MKVLLGRLPRNPLLWLEIAPDLSALVTMLLGFLGLVLHLAEWVFGIVDRFSDDFQRFGHSLMSFVQV